AIDIAAGLLCRVRNNGKPWTALEMALVLSLSFGDFRRKLFELGGTSVSHLKTRFDELSALSRHDLGMIFNSFKLRLQQLRNSDPIAVTVGQERCIVCFRQV